MGRRGANDLDDQLRRGLDELTRNCTTHERNVWTNHGVFRNFPVQFINYPALVAARLLEGLTLTTKYLGSHLLMPKSWRRTHRHGRPTPQFPVAVPLLVVGMGVVRKVVGGRRHGKVWVLRKLRGGGSDFLLYGVAIMPWRLCLDWARRKWKHELPADSLLCCFHCTRLQVRLPSEFPGRESD
jgi:hypothetical protein